MRMWGKDKSNGNRDVKVWVAEMDQIVEQNPVDKSKPRTLDDYFNAIIDGKAHISDFNARFKQLQENLGIVLKEVFKKAKEASKGNLEDLVGNREAQPLIDEVNKLLVEYVGSGGISSDKTIFNLPANASIEAEFQKTEIQ